MEDRRKTKAELVGELARARQRIAEITSRDGARAKAREAEESRETATDGFSGDGVVIAKDGVLLDVNGRSLEMFGYGSTREVAGKPVSILAHPDDASKLSGYAGSGRQGEDRCSPWEFRGKRKDGTLLQVEAYAMAASLGGESVRLLCLRDVAERKEALVTLEKRLRAEEFIAALSTGLVGASDHEIDRRAQDALRTIGEFSGVDDVSLVLFPTNGTLLQRGYNWRRPDREPRPKEKPLLPFPWIEERLSRTDVVSVQGKESLPLEAGAERKTWEVFGIASVLAIPLNAAGRLIGCIVFPSREKEKRWMEEDLIALKLAGRILATALSPKEDAEAPEALLDESDRKKLEEQLIQSEKMRAIGTLAGGIAHDFNNILMGIQGYASLMLHHLDSSHLHFSKLKGIEELVESGSDLTKQLLGFASGGMYEIRPTDLNEIVKKTSTMFARTRKEIEIQSRCEGDPCVVDADPGQLEQMLLNLYVNGWQAMPNGGTLVVTTETVTLDRKFVRPYMVKQGKYAKISVADTGIGMDEKTRERIFEPFFTTKKRARGTGLGLSSVYNVVKGHNGIITVTSEKGCGATFCIYLPLSKRTVEKVKPASQDVLKGVETVLLVDDEETVVSVSKDMLEALGYSVLVARSGPEAVAIFEKEHNRIDLVILDVIMPGMGGAETFEEIRRIDASANVILSSGYSLDGLATRIMERGCKAFIQKPFTINLLSQKLRDVLGRT